MPVLSRRATLAFSLAGTLLASRRGLAAEKSVTIGADLSLTGGDAEMATIMRAGIVMAAEEANAKGGIGGYQVKLLILDDGTATAGQYDPAQAATNARKMVAEATVVAAVGPMSSGAGKAMAPILSEGNLAIITPSSTNPDLTDPKFAPLYKPAGKNIYFRTVTTDAYQGPNLANYFADALKVKSVYVLDDSGAYGVGIADAFQAQAAKKGIAVHGRDRLDPKAADYTAILTKVKGMGSQALYFGGDAQAGVKVAKQSYEIIPGVIKAGGDGMYGTDILKGAGFPASNGWYATLACPHSIDDAAVQSWSARVKARFGSAPSDYTITSYDAMLVIFDAIARVAAAGKPVNRATVRDAIETAKVNTLQGEVAFDANGDLKTKTVALFQVKYDPSYPADDTVHQFKYVGVAPAESV